MVIRPGPPDHGSRPGAGDLALQVAHRRAHERQRRHRRDLRFDLAHAQVRRHVAPVQHHAARLQFEPRRGQRAPHALDEPVVISGLSLVPATRRVSHDGLDLRLGPTEFKLLHFLMTHPERVHSRSQLLDRVWGDHVFIEERTVDVHVKRLRESLAPAQCAWMIETVRGAGYRLTSRISPLGS